MKNEIKGKAVKTKPAKTGIGARAATKKGLLGFLELDLETLSLLVAKIHSILILESLRLITDTGFP